jgi:hypothetical protein
MSERTIRWAGLAAIVFVVLIVVSVLAGGSPPAIDASAAKIRQYFVDHRGGLLAGQLLGIIGVPLAVWFAVVLRSVVRGDRTANALGTASLAGLLITAPMAMAGGSVSIGAVYVDGVAKNLGDDTVRMLYVVQSLLFTCTAAGIVLFASTAALAIRRTGALPVWTVWIGLLAAVANVVTMFAFLGPGASALGFVGVIAFALFMLAAGIAMASGKVVLPDAAAATTPAAS